MLFYRGKRRMKPFNYSKNMIKSRIIDVGMEKVYPVRCESESWPRYTFSLTA
jgi:hypothetical protein